MAWNLMKKRRDNLEKDKADQPLLFRDTVTKEFAPAGSDEPSLGVKAQQRGLDISNAQKDSDEPAISGPFPGGGKGQGTWSGAIGGEPFHNIFGGGAKSGKAAPQVPTPTPEELEQHHRRQAEKYKPGNLTTPSEGAPNLSPKEKEELAPEIDMKPRE